MPVREFTVRCTSKKSCILGVFYLNRVTIIILQLVKTILIYSMLGTHTYLSVLDVIHTAALDVQLEIGHVQQK